MHVDDFDYDLPVERIAQVPVEPEELFDMFPEYLLSDAERQAWLETRTGAIVGSLIGLVLGIPLRRLMYLVILSMWSGIVMWTFGMEFVYLFAGTTGKIICYAVTAGVLGYSLALRVGRGRP